MDIREAVLLAQNGDQEGFNWLYRETVKRCHYVAMRYVKQEELANDVLQDAYIKAYFNLNQLQEPEKFSSWMARIVASKALDELKKKKVILFSQLEGEEDNNIDLMFEDDRIDTQPELAYDKKEIEELVKEMIDTLSDEQRICIMMFYLEEMSVKEIAEVIGCSENTIKSRLSYGRKNIKEKVLELEKKGIKLRSVSPFVFFLCLLLSDSENSESLTTANAVLESIKKQISQSNKVTGTKAEMTSPDNIDTVNNIVQTGKVLGGLSGKNILIGIIAVSMVTIGGIYAVYSLQKQPVEQVAEMETQKSEEILEEVIEEPVIQEAPVLEEEVSDSNLQSEVAENIEDIDSQEEIDEVAISQMAQELSKVCSESGFEDTSYNVYQYPKTGKWKFIISAGEYPEYTNYIYSYDKDGMNLDGEFIMDHMAGIYITDINAGFIVWSTGGGAEYIYQYTDNDASLTQIYEGGVSADLIYYMDTYIEENNAYQLFPNKEIDETSIYNKLMEYFIQSY